MSVFDFSPAISAYFLVFSLVFGAVFGSFCNAWAWRIVHHEKITKGRSHCPKCGHTLGLGDLIPIVSWLVRKGRCKYCGNPISVRYLLSELILGLYFMSVIAVYGLSLDTLRFWALGCFLLVMSLEDIDIMEIENGLQIGAAACVLLKLGQPDFFRSILSGIAVAAVLLILVLIFEKVLKREAMGGADIKLVAVLGLHFGLLQTLYLIIIACIVGLLAAVILKKGFGREFPFGPSLAIAAWITILTGPAAVSAYKSLFSISMLH